MKTFIVIVTLVSCVVGSAAEEVRAGAFLTSQPSTPKHFGLVDAQALADAQRVDMYGVCGMCTLKEKNGPVWIFETKVGYSAAREPDTIVVEPSVSLPQFEMPKKEPNQSLEPTRMDARHADEAPGPRGSS